MKPLIDRRYTLSENPHVLFYIGQEYARGKVVVIVEGQRQRYPTNLAPALTDQYHVEESVSGTFFYARLRSGHVRMVFVVSGRAVVAVDTHSL